MVAKINDPANIVNVNTDPIVTASNVAGVITLTAKPLGAIPGAVSFKVAHSLDALNDLAPVVAYTGGGTAPAYQGVGTGAYVVELEYQAKILKGVTTFLGDSNAGATAADFGTPTNFANPAGTYTLYTISVPVTEKSPTPLEQHINTKVFYLAIPAAGGPDAAVSKILLNI